MTQAYVLVQTQPQANGIARDLLTIPGVVLAEDLRGPYDAIAFADTDVSGRGLDRVVADIRTLPGVTRALSAPLGNGTVIATDEAA
jgi:hypothetical protein